MANKRTLFTKTWVVEFYLCVHKVDISDVGATVKGVDMCPKYNKVIMVKQFILFAVALGTAILVR